MPEIFQKLKKADAVYDKMYKLLMLICKLLLIADICITTGAGDPAQCPHPHDQL